MHVSTGRGSIVQFIAGFLVLAATGLAFEFSAVWLLLAGFVGFMLMLSAVTGFCPLALILGSCGVPQMSQKH